MYNDEGMELSEYLLKYDKQLGHLEKQFIIDVYFADYGEEGLLKIQPQVGIYNDSTGEKYRIDFVLSTRKAKYAIETDGLYYHASGKVSKQYFNRLQRKQNEIINQEYKLIRFTSSSINAPKDAMYELRRVFIDDEEMISLRLRKTKIIAPHEIQREALTALAQTRSSGQNKGVVVLATGVGKTYLSAFDAKQMGVSKILFVVHITEILRQSYASFEDIFINRSREMGFYYGKEKDGLKNILFASVQTLSKSKNLNLFTPSHFDYIIIDETHHIAAPTYSKLFQYFKPRFFLGLTATPDRMDKKDILGHFDDNLVYEIDQKTAIHKGMLVPYKYFGFRDNVDYGEIRWNGYHYNITDLNKVLLIAERDQAILSKFMEYCHDKRTIGFCVSIEHAQWMTQLFNSNGISAIDIHSLSGNLDESGEESFDAKERIKAFKAQEYQVAFVVDMFNEGVDIEDVECLLFLRPTESKTIFIQQMGRGLRLSPRTSKKDVIILDFIGNYKTALHILDGLGIGSQALRDMKHELDQNGKKMLYHYDNNGCKVYFQDETIDLLKELQSQTRRKVDYGIIDREWVEYASFARQASIKNLYLKIGQQNKHIPVQLEAVNIIANKPDIREKDFIQEMHKITQNKDPRTSMKAGFRGLMLGKILGLVQKPDPSSSLRPAPVFSEITNRIGTDSFDNLERYQDIITRQMEKLLYWNPLFGTFNKYKKHYERVDFHIFSNYPVIFINLVLFELRDRFGYQDKRISKKEIDYFIIFAKKLDEYKATAELIARYREYSEKAELEKTIGPSYQEIRFSSLWNLTLLGLL